MKERLESTAEKYEGMKELITLGREKGYLLYDEVNSVLPDHISSSKDLDSIFSLFGDAGIEVIDSEKVLEVGKQKTRSQEPEEEKEQKPDPAMESLEKTDDPVRMYLREMGTVPLLTWPGEVEIAKRMEKGKKSVLKALSHSPIVVRRISEYGDQLRKNTLRIKSLVKFSEDEVTEEILTKRRRLVLRRINQITALEKEAVKVRKRLRRAKKSGKAYKKLLSQLARYQIPMARIILDLELTAEVFQGFVGVIENSVDRIVTLERETKQLKKLKVSSLKLDEAKKVKLRLRVIDKEMKEIDRKSVV
jgi:RNA polymerase primary sigma factor